MEEGAGQENGEGEAEDGGDRARARDGEDQKMESKDGKQGCRLKRKYCSR